MAGSRPRCSTRCGWPDAFCGATELPAQRAYGCFHLADGLPEWLSPHRATYDALVAARLFVKLATWAATLEELRGSRPEKGDDDAPALF